MQTANTLEYTYIFKTAASSSSHSKSTADLAMPCFSHLAQIHFFGKHLYLDLKGGNRFVHSPPSGLCRVINRPGEAMAALQTPLSLINRPGVAGAVL